MDICKHSCQCCSCPIFSLFSLLHRLARPQVIESESIDYFMEAPQLDFAQTKNQLKLAEIASKRAY